MTTYTPHEIAEEIAQVAFDAVPNSGDWPIARNGVVIGEIVWDNCQCGQLVVTERRRYPSMTFPLEEVDHTAPCGEPWLVVAYTLSLTRCVPISDESGNPPSIAALAASAERNSLDMSLVRAAVMCWLSAEYDANRISAYELGAQDVVGPQGQCGGFEMTFTVGWTNDCGCG